jgi:hypothetical protein
MDDKYLPQHTRLAMGEKIVAEPISRREQHEKTREAGKKIGKWLGLRGGGAVNKPRIKGLRGGGSVKKTGIKK